MKLVNGTLSESRITAPTYIRQVLYTPFCTQNK